MDNRRECVTRIGRHSLRLKGSKIKTHGISSSRQLLFFIQMVVLCPESRLCRLSRFKNLIVLMKENTRAK
jgi:hypothetical protein